MSPQTIADPIRFDVPCTVEVAHTFDSLHAHVTLDAEVDIAPGDEVLVHGDDIAVPYGETVELHRQATVTKAPLLERWLARIKGDLEFMDLFEISFSSWRKL